jgi:ATP-binding cassette, subfamily B, bacterial HlyB/CyaB
MTQIMRRRTVIVIAHRLAAVRCCHRLSEWSMDAWPKLLANPNGLYARLWNLQTGLVLGNHACDRQWPRRYHFA